MRRSRAPKLFRVLLRAKFKFMLRGVAAKCKSNFHSVSLSRRHFSSADAGSYNLVCPKTPSPQILFFGPTSSFPPFVLSPNEAGACKSFGSTRPCANRILVRRVRAQKYSVDMDGDFCGSRENGIIVRSMWHVPIQVRRRFLRPLAPWWNQGESDMGRNCGMS